MPDTLTICSNKNGEKCVESGGDDPLYTSNKLIKIWVFLERQSYLQDRWDGKTVCGTFCAQINDVFETV